jgi:hypothetical protein
VGEGRGSSDLAIAGRGKEKGGKAERSRTQQEEAAAAAAAAKQEEGRRKKK